MRRSRWLGLSVLLLSACGEGKPQRLADAGRWSEQDADTQDSAERTAEQDAQDAAGSSESSVERDASVVNADDDAWLRIDAGPALAPRDAASVDAQDARVQPSPTAVFSTDRYIGGYDHYIITMRDEARGSCALLNFIYPARPDNSTASELELPNEWGLAISAAGTSADACGDEQSDGGALTYQVPVRGRVQVRRVGEHQVPCSLDLDLELERSVDAGVTQRERLFAEDLAIPCQ